MRSSTLKLVRIVIGAAVGALMWAGCTSRSQSGLTVIPRERPVDLTQVEPDTHPELVPWQPRLAPKGEQKF